MKICYLSSVLTVHDCRFLAELAKRDFEVCLVTYFDGEIPEDIKKLKGVEIIHRRPRYFHKIQKYLFFAKRNDFCKILKTIKPDILQGGWVWKDGYLAARSEFHPFLLMPWGTDVLEHPRRPEPKSWQLPNPNLLSKLWSEMKWRSCRWIVKRTIRRADKIVCDCMEVKDSIMKMTDYPEDKIDIFRWGIDLDQFKPVEDMSGIRGETGWEKNKVLISNRSFRPEYGINYFIEALPAIIEAEPSARVILAGEGPEEDRLRKMVKNKGLEDFVHFTGAIPPSEMPGYLNAADIYVSPSLTDGTSISLLEAFACGLPVVVNGVQGNNDWVQDKVNGLLAPTKDTEKFAEKIITLLKDPDMRKNMSEKNLEIAKDRANWEKNFDRLQETYIRLVEDYRE